jgi:ferredoxin
MTADVKFEREERDGIVAVGTYLIDAAGRLGVEIDAECDRHGECDSCAVTVKQGGNLLSETTQAEIEHLSDQRRKDGERLACQAKIEKSGEVVIMTKEKVVEEKPKVEEKTEEFRKEFEKMPLDAKVASLLELEMITLSETVSYIFNSPYEVVGKVMDVMANFGRQKEDESKEAKRPEEHKSEAENEEAEIPVKKTESKKKEEAATKKTTTAKKKPAAKKPVAKTTENKEDNKVEDKKEE